MQPIEIFSIGNHTAMNGVSLPFDRNLLSAACDAYKPAVHEAPIVIGHPKDNHPAFGWIDHLELTDNGVVLAHPKQVNADFAELVKNGSYKKRSASWYLPDSPSNPVPGTLYLRHVGFLGAMPPALKGLGDVQFNEAEEGVVEFASPYIWSTIGKMFRGVREWLIGEKGLDVANAVIPDFYVSEIEQATTTEVLERQALNESTSYSEGDMSQQTQETPEQKIARLEIELAKRPAAVDFSEQEKALKTREAVLAKREVTGQIDQLIAEGKVLPAEKTGLVEFMSGLNADELIVEFGEGDKIQKLSQRAYFDGLLKRLPASVDFNEHSGGDDAQSKAELTASDLAVKTAAYHAKQSQAGNHISFSEAAAAVASGLE